MLIIFSLGRSALVFSSERTLNFDLRALKAQAQENGYVRVIVDLDIGKPFVPEGYLPNEAARQAQRNAIAAAQNGLLNALARQNINATAQFTFVPGVGLEVDAAALDALATSPFVANVAEDKISYTDLASSIPVIGADAAWAAGYDGTGQTVAVLDTGVDGAHAYLTGKLVSEACYSTNNGSSIKSLCPNGKSSQTGAGAANPLAGKCATVSNMCDHGTHVAGIVASQDVTNTGVAKDADIIGIQVFTWFGSGAGGCSSCIGAYTADIILGLQRVYALRNSFSIASVNMSLGGGGPYNSNCDSGNSVIKGAMDNLKSVDIATVVASANNGWTNGISYPACISTAISVGATNDADKVAYFSNVGNILDLFAPGMSIVSSVPGGGTANYQGTSMAAPHVAGAWAVMRDRFTNGCSENIRVDVALSKFKSTGLNVRDIYRSDESDGSGLARSRIQLDAAIADCLGPVLAPTNLIANPLSNTEIEISWESTAVEGDKLKFETSLDGTNWGEPSTGSYYLVGLTRYGLNCNTSYYYRIRIYRPSLPEYSDYSNIASGTTLPCPPPGDFIFADGFESGDYSNWDETKIHSGGSGSLAVNGTAAIFGSYGLELGGLDSYVFIVDKTPAHELRYRVRFYINVSTLNTPEIGRHVILMTKDGYSNNSRITLKWDGVNYSVFGEIRDEANDFSFTTSRYNIQNGANYIEMDLKMASSPGGTDGHYSLWVNGIHVETISGIDNHGHWVDSVFLGDYTGYKGTTGSLYIDSFESRRISYIGYESPAQTAPANVAATDGGSTAHVQVSWDAVPGTDDYQVWRSTSSDSASAVKVDGFSSSPFDDSATVPLTTYYYWVKACKIFVCSVFSASDAGFRADSVPPVTTGVTATDGVYPGHVVVQWDADIIATYYEVWRDTDADEVGSILLDSPTSNSYFDVAVTDLTVYYYWVKSCGAMGCSGLGTPDSGYADATALPTFTDVPFDHPFYAEIEALWIAGFTAGCTSEPLDFCPATILDRAQSAVFLLRGQFGSGYVPPIPPWGNFVDDWSGGIWAEKWAEGMWLEGLTSGCIAEPLTYCPWDQLPREQAAVFGLRMLHGMDYVPPPATGTLFDDMTDTAYWATKWAEQAYLDGLILACTEGPLTFCPTDLVSRAEGAYLIVQAKDLPLP